METTTIIIIMVVAAAFCLGVVIGMVIIRNMDNDPPIGDLKAVEDEFEGTKFYYMELDRSVVGVQPYDYISTRRIVKLNVSFSEKFNA